MPWVDLGLNPAVKTGIRPLVWASDVSMLDRIIVNVIKVSFIVVLTFQAVLPETWLPNAASTFAMTPFRNV